MNILRLFLSRQFRRLEKQLQEEQWARQRLETICRRQQLAIDELATDVEKLSNRICAIGGRLGGRGNKRPTDAQGRLPLSEMPPAERKEALREMIRTGELKHTQEK